MQPLTEIHHRFVFVITKIGKIGPFLKKKTRDLMKSWKLFFVQKVLRIGEVVKGKVANCDCLRLSRVLTPYLNSLWIQPDTTKNDFANHRVHPCKRKDG
jgi:hypothetical protein